MYYVFFINYLNYFDVLPKGPIRPLHPAVTTIQLPPLIAYLTHTIVSLTASKHSVSVQALRHWISWIFSFTWTPPQTATIRKPVHIRWFYTLSWEHSWTLAASPTVTLRIVCLHQEKLLFLVLEGSTADIILGRPWMTQHSPKVNWNTGEITQRSEFCLQTHICLPQSRTQLHHNRESRVNHQNWNSPRLPGVPRCVQ